MNRKRTQTEGSDASDHFVSVNERPVDDIREFTIINEKIISLNDMNNHYERRDYFNVFSVFVLLKDKWFFLTIKQKNMNQPKNKIN